MRKRKKGSTLITVLALSIVFMALGGVILTAIMGTMKSNTNQKIREDLKYAAESGLEIARSHLSGKATITQSDIDDINKNLKNILVDTNGDNIPDKQIGEVKLISPTIDVGGNINNTKSGKINEFKIKIRATKRDAMDTYEDASVNYNRASGHSTDIFDNGVVAGAGGITIENGGSIDGQTSNISTGKPIESNGSGNTNLGPIKDNTIGNLAFTNWNKSENLITMREDFNFYVGDYGTGKKAAITKISMKMENNILKVVENPAEDAGKYIKSLDKEPILEIEIAGLCNPNMKIYLINADKLNIEAAGSMMINNTVIVCDGDIKVTGATAANGVYYNGALHLSYSTIFGESVSISYGSALHLAYQPSVIGGHGYLNEAMENELDKFLGALLPNWDAGNSNGENFFEIQNNTFES